MLTESEMVSRKTILLAEDERLLRELGETILRQAGYKVVTAPGAEELRALVSEYSDPVDLLLTDVIMPGLGGQELVALVKRRWPDIRILYMSGYSSEEIDNLDRDAGFLQKPFTPGELMKKISDLFNANARNS
jgi:DNA-binding response OmpR family regulator